MAVQGKLTLNYRAVSDILKHDPGGIAAVDEAAEKIKAESGARASMHTYTTDRHAAGVTVPAIEQAKHGAVTKALGILGRGLRHEH